MAEVGYIKVSRKYFDNFLWKEARVYSKAEAWLDLIRMARFEASTEVISNKVIEIQRGEIPASRRYLEKRWQWGGTKVVNFMNMLSKMGMINQRQASGQTIYRLENYSTYNDAKPRSEPQTPHEQTTDEPSTNQSKGTKRKVNETKYKPLQYLLSRGVEKEAATEWLNYRRVVKKASVSKSVIDKIEKVAVAVGMTLTEALAFQEEKNWTGFDKTWINKPNTNSNERTATTRTAGTKKEQVHNDLFNEVYGGEPSGDGAA